MRRKKCTQAELEWFIRDWNNATSRNEINERWAPRMGSYNQISVMASKLRKRGIHLRDLRTRKRDPINYARLRMISEGRED